jgi:hypothetical protein
MEVSALRFKCIDLNGPCLSQKLSIDGDSTKSNVHLVSDFKVLKASCNTNPYGVATNDLKQVEDLASFFSKLLKCSNLKHTNYELMFGIYRMQNKLVS